MDGEMQGPTNIYGYGDVSGTRIQGTGVYGRHEVGADASRRGYQPGNPAGNVTHVEHHHIPIFRQIAALPATAIAVLPGDYPVQILPQRAFRLERLILEDANQHQLSPLAVDAITVGADPQFLTVGSLPIETFAALSVGLQLTGQTADPGIQLIVSIQNLAGAPIPASTVVTGGFFGASIMPGNMPNQTHVTANHFR